MLPFRSFRRRHVHMADSEFTQGNFQAQHTQINETRARKNDERGYNSV
jgi:hypothetical protein